GWRTLRRESETAVTNRPAAMPLPPLPLLVLLFALLYGLLLLAGPAHAGTQISSARVWSAQEYTRVTLETQAPVKHTLLILQNPARLVLDLEDVDMTTALSGLAEKIGAADPYVKAVRVGRYKPGI